MFKDLLFVLWLAIPTALANIAPIPAAKIPLLKNFNYPLDFHKTYNGKRILGDHKTIRGIIIGVLVAIITVYLQIFLYKNSAIIRSISLINYTTINPILLGGLQGFGALMGDAAKSFFKRQMGIPSGKSWVPFDQIDFVLGSILFTSWYVHPTLQQCIIALLLGFILHTVITFFGWILGLKDSPI
jgi:CDP-2,3-bis-(O-geranylgeranyl)-sn-glycerol synthase